MHTMRFCKNTLQNLYYFVQKYAKSPTLIPNFDLDRESKTSNEKIHQHH